VAGVPGLIDGFGDHTDKGAEPDVRPAL